MKKVIAAALSLALLVSGATFAADTEIQLTEGPGTVDIGQLLGDGTVTINGEKVRISSLASDSLVCKSGPIQFTEEATPRIILMKTGTDGDEAELVLNTDENTLVLDATTGDPADLASLQEGDTVYAYVSPVMALSYPAQSYAALILVNIIPDMVVPIYAEIGAVRTNDQNTNVVLETDQSIHLTLTDETEITPYLTRQLLTKDNFIPGMKVLAWNTIVMDSYPAQATPYKVIGFNTSYSALISVDTNGAIAINGETLDVSGTSPYLQAMEGADTMQYMVPLRKAAEVLGCTVTWDGASRHITVSSGEETLYAISIDAETTDDGRYLTHVLDGKTGVTYIDLNDLITLHNLKFVQ
ncbi:MAG: copper amine oxidase N-terminal domain-containing protein [Oscillospiraceae bacterium]|nr:copper amine oxidase N-terminal domain-containing protein [Oscillospiraceae bacterium]